MKKSAKIHHGRRAESRYIPGAAGIKAGGILSSQLEPNKNYGLHSSISKILQTVWKSEIYHQFMANK